MSDNSIIAAIDKELARLHKVRSVLIQKNKKAAGAGKGTGRNGAQKKGSKRRLSPEARARIAEAQRKRWAAARKGKRAQGR